MDSQLTLVNLDKQIAIVFNSSNIKSSSISLSTDPWTPLYNLCRSKPGGALEVYSSRAQRVVATVQKRYLRPDMVMVQDGLTMLNMRVDRWLAKETSLDNRSVRMISLAPGLSCYWKSSARHHLALYDSQDHKEPIATYNLSRKPESPIVIQFIRGHPALTSHMLEILLSFVVIEGKIRSQEKVDHILLAFAREEAAYLIY